MPKSTNEDGQNAQPFRANGRGREENCEIASGRNP